MYREKSQRLNDIRYDIRGPIYMKALEMEAQGQAIIPLNIGNPAAFGLEVPDIIQNNLKESLGKSGGYTHQLGNIKAREAVATYATNWQIEGLSPQQIAIGNGVSELILMSMQALLNAGDEVLVPAPDYPLWTAAVGLAGGKAVHYHCDEKNGWQPDLDDIERKISSKTKALVIINPNNPTGSVYNIGCLQSMVDLAQKHDLVVCSDEIYDHVYFDEGSHTACAALSTNGLFLTYGGLSKNHFAAGYRAGWMIMSGDTEKAAGFWEGINLLASMRLCSNALAQSVIPIALQHFGEIKKSVSPGGRLYEQKTYAVERINSIEGLQCNPPKGAMYVFPSFEKNRFDFQSDEDFVLKYLTERNVLLVPGTGFNHTDDHHFRLVFLADKEVLSSAFDLLESFLIDHKR
ncbi:MAG: aminotransferase class I/II-fold pyridoxal phosphate-dependent enzyme [Saprospiraceae bacterium]|nr:aminotransferase class I/II-fold pyridoxal phosphate-dependent enzyme [Saprospiraceae bacterium]